MLLISSYLVGQKKEFLIAKKGISRDPLDKREVYNWLWIVPPGSDSSFPQSLSNKEIKTSDVYFINNDHTTLIDKSFWVSIEDCLFLDNPKVHDNTYVEASFFGNFCCITPYKKPKNMDLFFLFNKNFNLKNDEKYYIDISKNSKKNYINFTKNSDGELSIDFEKDFFEKQNYINSSKKAYYERCTCNEPWVKNYTTNDKKPSNTYMYGLIEHVMVEKDEEEKIIPFSGKDDNKPYRVTSKEVIVSEEEVISRSEDDSEMGIYG